MTHKTRPLTPDEVRADLDRRGLTIAEWARRHQANYQTVRDVLSLRLKGRSGESHRVAVLLGLKIGEIEEVA